MILCNKNNNMLIYHRNQLSLQIKLDYGLRSRRLNGTSHPLGPSLLSALRQLQRSRHCTKSCQTLLLKFARPFANMEYARRARSPPLAARHTGITLAKPSRITRLSKHNTTNKHQHRVGLLKGLGNMLISRRSSEIHLGISGHHCKTGIGL